MCVCKGTGARACGVLLLCLVHFYAILALNQKIERNLILQQLICDWNFLILFIKQLLKVLLFMSLTTDFQDRLLLPNISYKATFFPFSFQYPPCYKDVSFWINEAFTENNLCEVVREVAGDLAEEVCLVFTFINFLEV